MLNRPIGAIDPLWAQEGVAPAGEGQAPEGSGQAVAEPAGTTPPAPEGQVATQAPAPEAGQVSGNVGSAPEPQPPFFEYEWEDGRKDSFSTDQDLRNAWREGHLRRDKFTQDMQKLSDREGELKSNQARYDAEYTQFLQQKGQMDEMQKTLDGLSEQEFSQLLNMVTRGRYGQERQQQIPPELRQELDGLKEFREQQEQFQRDQEMAEKRDEVYSQLENEIGEAFNRDAVQTEIQRVRDIDPSEQIREFAQLVHFSLIGRQKPIELARQAQASVVPSGGGSLPTPPTSGGSPPPPAAGGHAGALTEDEASGMSMKEIAARAKKQAGVT
jgi:hypothetical protein